MTFPMENPLFQFLYALVDTAGLGGLAVALVAGGSLTAYTLVLRWINRGGAADEKDTYSYPTPTLLHHDKE